MAEHQSTSKEIPRTKQMLSKTDPYVTGLWIALIALFIRLDPTVNTLWRSSVPSIGNIGGWFKAAPAEVTVRIENAASPQAGPKMTLVSRNPLVAHIANFLNPAEIAHIKELAKPHLRRSLVDAENGTLVESEDRTSSSAYLTMPDPLLDQIRRRAADMHGFLPGSSVDLQVTSYQPGQQYHPHRDWFLETESREQRLSTIFVTLEANCTNCGTQFPELKVDWSKRDPRWCEFVDCNQNVLTTKNVPGSALFWENIDSKGKGRQDVIHAGLPAINGTKMGLNVWTGIPLSWYKQYEGLNGWLVP